MKAARFALLAALACVALFSGAAWADGVRTLVVRGLVARADGKPAAGARVTAKGPLTVSATVDERGRYSLQMPMGSAAAIRGGAFRVEVRAELQGKRLASATGQQALAIEVAFVPGTTRLRVRSNSPSATAAVITAFAQDGVPTAWVDADFGGAQQANGALALNAEDEVALAGVAPAPGSAAAGAATPREKPVPARTPPPIRVKPADSATPPPAKPAPETTPVRAPSAPRTKPVAHAAPDSAALARAAALEATRAAEREASRAARRSRDSIAAVRRAERREAARVAAAEKRRKPAKPARATETWVATSPSDSLPASREPRVPATPVPATPVAPPVQPGATPGSRVVPIEPFTAPPVATPSDTCACRLRGTVEVEWEERPLEKNVLVELSLEGPARQEASVDLYMGPPREFRLGPLPCGDYRLVVRPRGRLRYTLARGDSVLVLRCDGHTEKRVVLVPAGR